MSRPKVWRCVKMIFLRALSIYREHLSVINPSMTVLYEEGGFSRALILAAFDILMRSRLPSSGVWTKVCLCDAPWIVDTKLKETIIKSFPPIKISENILNIFTDQVDGISDYVLLPSIVGMLNKTWSLYELNFLFIVL